MLNFLVILGIAVSAFMGFVFGVPGILNVDDLKGCKGPDVLTKNCHPADAIIAISGGDTVARTKEAVKLYHRGWAPKLILSGAALDPDSPSNARTMRDQAIEAGVSQDDIIMDEESRDTEQNASFTKPLVGANKHRVILVTSPYHQRRAGLEFQRAFGKDIKVVNHPAPSDKLWPTNWYANPASWILAVSEMIKTLVVIIKPDA